MSIKNTTWSKVAPGDIVTFVYKASGASRGYKRTVLCINPELRYRKKSGRTTKFFVGLQLFSQDDPNEKIRPNELKRIMDKLGAKKESGAIKVEVDSNNDMTKQETAVVVEKLKPFMDNYRTFRLRECRRRRVFLETKYDKIPNSVVRLIEQREQLNIEN